MVPLVLSGDDPPPFTAIAGRDGVPLLLVCDHASNRIPSALGDLGLPLAERERHIGWDIGAAAVTRRLAARFGAPAVLAGYSRLVADCNRHREDPGIAPEVSDGTPVPANRGLSDEQLEARLDAVYRPYHAAVERALEAFAARGQAPLFVSIHSCTPTMNGRFRPWHIGVCWHRDTSLSEPLLRTLAQRQGVTVGDNEPYGLDDTDYTVPVHAETRGLRHVQIEFRQDLIGDDAGALYWADLFGDALAPLVAAAA